MAPAARFVDYRDAVFGACLYADDGNDDGFQVVDRRKVLLCNEVLSFVNPFIPPGVILQCRLVCRQWAYLVQEILVTGCNQQSPRAREPRRRAAKQVGGLLAVAGLGTAVACFSMMPSATVGFVGSAGFACSALAVANAIDSVLPPRPTQKAVDGCDCEYSEDGWGIVCRP
eukprot:TRINITY_DN11531_c0_g1_i2.p1 TRINITY_DN11531_c0_g1~~TRINITY_DN11531_c0_g1_i2.p1  ORF type:complete len:171 (+),score=19.98 TRINITY_DN11531_c0_g1_i2:45-557(+)